MTVDGKTVACDCRSGFGEQYGEDHISELARKVEEGEDVM